MRLELVTGTPFKCTCVKCGATLWAGNGFVVYADLNGKAFSAYYCADCAEKGKESNVQG